MKKPDSTFVVSNTKPSGVYIDADLDGFDPSQSLACPANFHSRAASTNRCTAIGSGQCGSSPASAGRPTRTERFRYLLDQGQTGLSTAFDLPTLMGLDSDNPRSAGEVGRLGVAVDTVDDMLALFDQIDLERVSVSMTINAPAIVVMAFYLAARPHARLRLAGSARHDPKRHPQGVSRTERSRVSARAFRAAGRST